MPVYEEGETVYALKKVVEGPSDHGPGGQLCGWGDKLIVKGYGKYNPRWIAVTHETVTDGSSFYVYANEISRMQHFEHNKPYSNGGLYSVR